MKDSSNPFQRAVIVYANYAQFGPGQTKRAPCVKSRMVLWCKAGTGVVSVNKKECLMEAGRCLFLPWAHQIYYKADREDPFFLGGVHIVPEHAVNKPVAFDVAHDDRHPLAQVQYRKDVNIPELRGLKIGFLDSNAPLLHLLEYIAGLFVRKRTDEWMARSLAQLLLCEWRRFEQRSELYDHDVPPSLERMKQFIASHLHTPLSLRDLVEFSRLSPSTVGRIFRENLGVTPVSWIMQMKIERAKILMRTRQISVADVGAQVGIPDPYYFSKCFRKATGISPQEYRKQPVWI
jgi:AraC-like DNA-binding protein